MNNVNTLPAWPPKAPQPSAKLTEAALRLLSCPACDDNVWKGEAIAFDEFEHYYKDLDEDAWKIAWKINYMKRLNSVADAAWANHLDRMAQDAAATSTALWLAEERNHIPQRISRPAVQEEERSCLSLWDWDAAVDNNDQETLQPPPIYRSTADDTW